MSESAARLRIIAPQPRRGGAMGSTLGVELGEDALRRPVAIEVSGEQLVVDAAMLAARLEAARDGDALGDVVDANAAEAERTEQAGSARVALHGVLDLRDLAVEHVGEDLAPKRRARAASDRAQRG